jgi:hypothetical protein
LTSTEGRVSLTAPTQKSVVFCTQSPVGEHHTKKADEARQSKRFQRQNTHTQAPRDTARDTRAFPHHHIALRPSILVHRTRSHFYPNGSGFLAVCPPRRGLGF